MKTLILYNSKKGFTLKCAEYLHNEIKDSDLFSIDSKEFNFEDYEKVLIGAPIYFGGVNKDVVKFLNKNRVILLKKKLGMFYSGMNKEDISKTVQESLPADLFYHAEIVHSGGAYYFEKMNFLQRMIVKKVANVYKTTEDFKIEKLKSLI
jgi:menaquinone-dependent protoporphyrinogen oxidase